MDITRYVDLPPMHLQSHIGVLVIQPEVGIEAANLLQRTDTKERGRIDRLCLAFGDALKTLAQMAYPPISE